ncbi:MAG: ATP-binding cassette domain-containing protein [Gammaproteobacteria bacterium]|nr:ATP-binding cassette domain-containing protein [Gammaproteobacteria bacterium]
MIKISGLTKTFPGGAQALNGIDLEVKPGEILALLGPNGAGKTTTVRVLTTLCGFDEGQVTVAGHDVDVEPEKVRQAIGYVAQETGVDYFLTGRENLTLQGQLYRMTRADIQARSVELSEYFGLTTQLDQLVSTYSGGMRRKLDIATALIHRPKMLFLDEPTLGLDSPSRQSLWQYVRRLNADLGLTILLTTHYLDEADKLAHRVAIIDNGKIQVIDTPNALKDTIKGDAVSLELADSQAIPALQQALQKITEVQDVRVEGLHVHVYAAQGASLVPTLIDIARACGAEIKNLRFARPSLDDVFLRYTGSSITRKQEAPAQEEWWKKWAGKGGGKWQKQWPQEKTPATESAPPAETPWQKWENHPPTDQANSPQTWPQQEEWNGASDAQKNTSWPQGAWSDAQQWSSPQDKQTSNETTEWNAPKKNPP